jgi:hypothetical protein
VGNPRQGFTAPAGIVVKSGGPAVLVDGADATSEVLQDDRAGEVRPWSERRDLDRTISGGQCPYTHHIAGAVRRGIAGNRQIVPDSGVERVGGNCSLEIRNAARCTAREESRDAARVHRLRVVSTCRFNPLSLSAKHEISCWSRRSGSPPHERRVFKSREPSLDGARVRFRSGAPKAPQRIAAVADLPQQRRCNNCDEHRRRHEPSPAQRPFDPRRADVFGENLSRPTDYEETLRTVGDMPLDGRP